MTAVEVTPAVAAARAADGAFVLDVRQPEEWTDQHIDGATLIPLSELDARVDELPRDRSIVVLCRSGSRSGMATEALRAAGFDAANLEGGMIAWAAAGLPTVGG